MAFGSAVTGSRSRAECRFRSARTKAIAALRDLLFEAVGCRLDRSYPVASLLSGGLDSSSIVAIACPLSRETESGINRNIRRFTKRKPHPFLRRTRVYRRISAMAQHQHRIRHGSGARTFRFFERSQPISRLPLAQFALLSERRMREGSTCGRSPKTLLGLWRRVRREFLERAILSGTGDSRALAHPIPRTEAMPRIS